MSEKKFHLMGVGNAITDHLIEVEEEFLSQHVEGEKGGMELAEIDLIESLIAACPGRSRTAPGGAAANTVRTAARLGMNCKFMGMLGRDRIAEYYLEAFAESGCDTSAFRYHAEAVSGQCLSIITPDKQRTMRTHLGAAIELANTPISPEDFEECDILYLEGYLLFNRDLVARILDAGIAAGCRIAMDLGSFEVVKACEDILPQILREKVDFVLANEDEALAFAGGDDLGAALDALSGLCAFAAVKQGEKGAWIAADGRRVVVEPVPQPHLVDSTGAGDLWAAGLFYGIANGLSYERCGAVAAILGSAAVAELGGNISPENWDAVVADIDSILRQAKSGLA